MELARKLGGGKAYRLDDLPLILGQVDIVITSTGSPTPVITPELARKAVRQRKGNPLFFIDIAVPRDVDPKVGGFDGCFVFDIDDLSQVVQGNLRIRLKEAQKAEHIVDQEVVKFDHWLSSLDVVPTITDLTAKAEDLRQAELARTLKDIKGLTQEDSEALERLTRSLVKKLLHDPILFLKEQAHEKKPETKKEHTALFRRIFHLGEK
jgi:glutamyl-tRNA reductase